MKPRTMMLDERGPSNSSHELAIITRPAITPKLYEASNRAQTVPNKHDYAPVPTGHEQDEPASHIHHASTSASKLEKRMNSFCRAPVFIFTFFSTLLKGKGTHTQDKDSTAKWQPFWLRRITLVIFGTFFAACSIALPIMLSFSQTNQGLGEVRTDLSQAWKFGPTAVLTLVAIFWSRVEFQAMRYTPWVVAQPQAAGQPQSRNILALDYTAMLLPEVFIESIRNKHFFVFSIALSSIFMKALVILSASVLFLSDVRVTDTVRIRTLDTLHAPKPSELRSTFISTRESSPDYSGSQLNLSITAPYYYARALQDFNMSYPFGVAKECAYQTFVKEDGKSRGTVNSPTIAIVDGLFPEATCLQLQNYDLVEDTLNQGADTVTKNRLNLFFNNCNVISPPVHPEQTDKSGYGIHWSVQEISASVCPSLPKQYTQILYLAELWKGPMDIVSNKNSQWQLEKVAAVICSVGLRSKKIKVIDNGVKPILESLPDEPSTALNTSFWDYLSSSIPLGLGDESEMTGGPGGPLVAAANFRKQDYYRLDLSLYKNELLQESIMNLTKNIGSFIGDYSFRQHEENSTTMGSTIKQIARLHVDYGVCISMTVLFIISTFVAFWGSLQSQNIFGAWYRDPATLLGSLMFFSGQPQFDPSHGDAVESLCSPKQINRKDLWASSIYTDIVLRASFRALFSSYILAIITTLTITLHMSETSNGIVKIPQGVLPIWWTSIPALAMFLAALYATSSDIAVRGLGILSNLSVRPCTLEELDISFLDMLGIRALYQSLRLKNFSITLTQILAIMCGFLTVLSTLLFNSVIVEEITLTSFQSRNTFASRSSRQFQTLDPNGTVSDTMGALLLTRGKLNITWPKNTYSDLLFPQLEINDTDLTKKWSSTTSIAVNVTAARIMPTCSRVPEADYQIDVSNETILSQLSYRVARQFICPNGSSITYKSFYSSLENNLTYVAQTLVSEGDIYDRYCGDWGVLKSSLPLPPWTMRDFFWGNFSKSERKFQHHAYWRCNYTYWAIPTTTTFVWSNGNLEMDYSKPPIMDASDISPWEPPFSIPSNSTPFPEENDRYSLLSGIDMDFKLALEPLGTLKLEDLSKFEKEEPVLQGLHSVYGLAWGQLANQLLRLNSTEPSPEPTLVTANIRDMGQHRLFQNRTITIVIVGILSSMLIVNVWALMSTFLRRFIGKRALLLDLEFKGLAPFEFNSIEMTNSLLQGSNFVQKLPHDAAQTSLDTLYQNFAWVHFRIGWFMKKGSKKRELTIGALGDNDFPFLGSK